MVGSGLRDREDIALDLVGVAGLTALAAGLVLLAPSDELGFDAAAAAGGVLGQLSTTLPAAVALAAVAAFDLAAGLAVARFARRTPFSSLGEALTWATVGAVLKNVVLLGLLGGLGLFRAPILWVVDGALVAPLAGEAVRRLRSGDGSALRLGAWLDRMAAFGSLPLAALAGAVWAGPLILQLASPVVPFIDVLPNHVAPAEHLRAFGGFDPLTTTQSPIYGPSRTLLGYVGWLGALTTMSGLPAALAVSAFIVPSAILVAVGGHALARSIVGPGLRLWPWVVLAFALTTSFARLGDVRGTVVVLPFVCAGLALAADRLSRAAGAPDPWWPGTGTAIGLALGVAILVHPVIGALAAATLALVGMARPAAFAVDGPIAGLVTTIVAGPQIATMLGIALPAWTLAAAAVLAIAAGATLGPLAERPGWPGRLELLVARLPLVLVGVLAALVVLILLTLPDLLEGATPDALWTAGELAFEAVQVLLVVLVAGWALGSPAARSPIVILGALAGIAAAVATQLIPGDAGLLGRALRFELPKTLYYWIPVTIALGAGATLAHVHGSPRLPWQARHLVLGLFVVIAALPLRAEPIDTLHLGERRWSEALAFDLRFAATGYWRGYPDSRQILDGPRLELVAAVREEILAGRLGPDDGVLHVARTFQQWDATPLGVFAGVIETTVSPDAEFSIHTVGGRLHRLDELDDLLAPRAFGYVLLEPSDSLPGDVRQRILGAGYVSIFKNDRGQLFAP